MCHGKQHRARAHSADLGGLLLATSDVPGSLGRGWIGTNGPGIDPTYAQNLTEMYTQSVQATLLPAPKSSPRSTTTPLFSDSASSSSQEDSPSFYELLPEATRTHLIQLLDDWAFEPYLLQPHLLVPCTLLLFEALFRVEGLGDVVGLNLPESHSSGAGIDFKRDVVPFIYQLRGIYRTEPRYHNYEHALDVLQACYMMLKQTGMVPSVRILLEDLDRVWEPTRSYDAVDGPIVNCLDVHDLFAIYITAIGHDVGHPGFSNAFMKSINSPLAVVYPSSSLEHMHHSLLMRTMRQYTGFRTLLEHPEHGLLIRNLVNHSVLATDMGVHDAFVSSFGAVLEARGTLMERRILVCQGIIKCADISNPARPLHISRRWCNALMKEWKAQSNLEDILRAQHSDKPSSPAAPTTNTTPPSIAEAKSQVFFISTFVKPLFELVTRGIPGTQSMFEECKRNLDVWQEVLASGVAPPSPPCSPTSDDDMDTFSTVIPFTLTRENRQYLFFHHSSSVSSSSASDTSNPSTPTSSEAPSLFPSSMILDTGNADIERAARISTLNSAKSRSSRSSWCGTIPWSLGQVVHT